MADPGFRIGVEEDEVCVRTKEAPQGLLYGKVLEGAVTDPC